MTKSNRSNQNQVIAAGAVAGLLVLIFGITYRVLAARLETHVQIPSMPAKDLEKLPLQIGNWAGRDVPLDEAIVRATDTDAHISREYSLPNNLENVWLYIAYGIKVRDLMPHRPEVCYIGAGWTLNGRSSIELAVGDGAKLPCNVFKFAKGTLNTKKVIVLDYYIVDGQFYRDVSQLRMKAFRGFGTIGYVAQVQIVAPIAANQSVDLAEKTIKTFAAASYLSISQLFHKAEDNTPQTEKRSGDIDNYGGSGSVR
jgi:EpsI family protein